MSVSPLDYRYCYPEMKKLFEEEYKLRKMIEVEVALAEAHALLGNIPKKDAVNIRKAANKVTLKRVKEIEKRIHHDVMAVAHALAEHAGKSGKYVHYCATSYDIVDTMWGMIIKDAISIMDKDLMRLERILLRLTKRYKKTLMVGRTHGQHALPITFGFKTALWASEIRNHRIRLKEMVSRVCVGKMSGAVGTFASYETTKIQRMVMKRLGLNEPRITNQVVQREGYAEFITWIAMLGATLEKIAKEIRNLARSEIKEVEEPFKKEQVGSSTMPQKRNPHKSERICGLARVLRSNVMIALENIALEHERDLTNSAAERLMIPESCIVVDYMMRQMEYVLNGLIVYEQRMKKHLEDDPFVMAESVMLALVKKGMGRQEAHELVRKAAMKAFSEHKGFRDVLMETKGMMLTQKELDRALDPRSYLGKTYAVIDKVIKELERWK